MDRQSVITLLANYLSWTEMSQRDQATLIQQFAGGAPIVSLPEPASDIGQVERYNAAIMKARLIDVLPKPKAEAPASSAAQVKPELDAANAERILDHPLASKFPDGRTR